MDKYHMITVNEKLEWQLDTEIDFIFNRFDLTKSTNQAIMSVDMNGCKYEIPVCWKDCDAQFGLWLSGVPKEAVAAAYDYLFKSKKGIKTVTYQNYLQRLNGRGSSLTERNHWSILLPEDVEELYARLSAKKRYNIKREKRLAMEQIGAYEVEEYSAEDVPSYVIEQYFQFKQSTYGIDYHMTPEEYLARFHVSNIYVLRFLGSNQIGAIICSCEQCPNVYLENLTYDPEYKKYSLGALLYDEYLGMLVRKGKRSLYLGYGHQVYKSLYGAHEDTVYSGTIYRSNWMYFRKEWLPQQKKNVVQEIKGILRRIDVFELRKKLRK